MVMERFAVHGNRLVGPWPGRFATHGKRLVGLARRFYLYKDLRLPKSIKGRCFDP